MAIFPGGGRGGHVPYSLKGVRTLSTKEQCPHGALVSALVDINRLQNEVLGKDA